MIKAFFGTKSMVQNHSTEYTFWEKDINGIKVKIKIDRFFIIEKVKNANQLRFFKLYINFDWYFKLIKKTNYNESSLYF